jgi:hypothetical protein
MSLPTSVTPTTLDTILGHLAPHFLTSANGDLPTARHAASHMLAAYNAETEEELRLAAEIVSFSFHALEALSEAAAPDLPVTRKLRLRGSAVSLSRESHKSQRKLDQLQRARLAGSKPPEVQALPPPDKPGTDQALRLIEFAREALDASARKNGAPALTFSRQQRRAAERIAEKLKRNQAEHERREARQAALAAKNVNQAGAV